VHHLVDLLFLLHYSLHCDFAGEETFVAAIVVDGDVVAQIGVDFSRTVAYRVHIHYKVLLTIPSQQN
jgi:hypothetical protein